MISSLSLGDPPADVGKRLFLIGLLVAALGILLFFVYLLVWDRSSTAQQVRAQVEEGWAGDQTIRGPSLVVPYSVTGTVDTGDSTTPRARTRSGHFTLAPQMLQVQADLRPSTRRRSLYDIIVYTADVNMAARFVPEVPEFAEGADIHWDRTRLVLAASDPRGFIGSPEVSVAGMPATVEAGLPGIEAPRGLVSVAAPGVRPGQPTEVRATLGLKGSRGFEFAPVAGQTRATIRSPWPHPSFMGALPDTQEISDAGFAARWTATNLSTGGQLAARGAAAGMDAGGRFALASVQLIEPVDLYGQLGRAVKYGILFIALTFLIVFVFDMTNDRTRYRRVPMLAYALSGLGLVLFYVLLLAFAEHIAFVAAYVTAAAMLVALVASYVGTVMRSRARGLMLAGGLSGLYGGLFLLIRLEDIALLLGSLILFAALAVLMFVTRNVAATDGPDRADDALPAAA